MLILSWIFLFIFIASSIVHLYASAKCNDKLRGMSKGFIVLSLALWYLCVAHPVRWIIFAALLLSWAGDVLLIPKGVKWFVAGGIAFMASHLCFALAYLPQIDFASINIGVIIIAAVAYGSAVVFIFRGLNPHLKRVLFYPMFFYLLINGLNNCFAFYQLMSRPCAATAVIFFGAVLFFASDSILFFVRFNKNTRFKSHFPVMLTYILAEFMITYGLVLLGG